LFEMASNPDAIHVRIFQQNDDNDVDCLDEYCANVSKKGEECPRVDQISVHKVHAKDAAGPLYARGMLSKDVEMAYVDGKLKPQDHCLSMDSHMVFVPEWDNKMLNMWDQAANEYAVLSTYVTDSANLGKTTKEVPHLCMVEFSSNIRIWGTKQARRLSKPKLTTLWGAGLSFSKCHAELKVPVDPHCPHIFNGEEFNRAARFWTHGYDMYTPNDIYILHDYHKSQSNPKSHTWGINNVVGSVQYSEARLRTMVDMPGGATDPAVAIRMKQSKHGLGDRRSLDQLIEFSGIDLRHQKVSIDGKNRCGNLQWVPFEEHPQGVNYIPPFDEVTEDPLDLPFDKTSIWYGMERSLVNNEYFDEIDTNNGVIRRIHKKQDKGIGRRGGDKKENVLDLLDKKHALLSQDIKLKKHHVSADVVKDKYEKSDNNKIDEHDEEIFINLHDSLDKKDAALLNGSKLSEQRIQENPELIQKIKDINKMDESIGSLRGKGSRLQEVALKLKKQTTDKIGNNLHDFLVTHKYGHPENHGFSQLPPAIKGSCLLLVIGFVISIRRSSLRVRPRNMKQK